MCQTLDVLFPSWTYFLCIDWFIYRCWASKCNKFQQNLTAVSTVPNKCEFIIHYSLNFSNSRTPRRNMLYWVALFHIDCERSGNHFSYFHYFINALSRTQSYTGTDIFRCCLIYCVKLILSVFFWNATEHHDAKSYGRWLALCYILLDVFTHFIHKWFTAWYHTSSFFVLYCRR